MPPWALNVLLFSSALADDCHATVPGLLGCFDSGAKTCYAGSNYQAVGKKLVRRDRINVYQITPEFGFLRHKYRTCKNQFFLLVGILFLGGRRLDGIRCIWIFGSLSIQDNLIGE